MRDMRHQAAEDMNRQLRETEDEESAPLPASLDSPRSSLQPRGVARSYQAWLSQPSALLALGLALLAVGAALVATPLALDSASPPSPPPPQQPTSTAASGLNEEGVPLDALPPEQRDGELADCRAVLPDRDAYLQAAAAAEAQLFGALAAASPPDQLQQAVQQLPPLLFGTVFWVLVSGARPWAPEFEAAAAAQVDTLNAAFAGLGMTFRLDFVVAAPATDDAVLHCSSHWEQLAQQLLPRDAGAGGGSGGGGGSSSSSGSGGGAADPPAIHVVVCEPEGAQGAAQVLGAAPPNGSAAGGVILLSRGALWQSRTSLVHQVGHFLGLAHPFPDERQTCNADADGVADTPLQHAANRGCDLGSDMHVCPESGDGALPASNFMDLTNDTCRSHFTAGQAVRMQAMLRAYRPRLLEAASAAPQPQRALAIQTAWQSAPPPASQAAGPWQAAALAADGQLSAAAAGCACLAPDAEGRAFWAAQLNASYPVEAVRLLLPAALGDGDGAGYAAGPSAAGPSAAPGPEAVAGGPPGEVEAEVELELRVGDSLEHRRNQRCAPGSNARVPLQQGQPLLEVRCAAGVAGRFVSVEVLAPGGAAALRRRLAQRPVCLCEVQPLTAAVPAVAVLASGSGSSGSDGWQPLPAALLNASAMEASQSTTAAAAVLALARQPAQADRGGGPQCSRTGAEAAPWWTLDTGLDGAWVRGLRLSVPFSCQASSAGSGSTGGVCQPAPAVSLTVHVGDLPPVAPPADNSSSLCAAAVPVLGGRPVEIGCAVGFLQGRYITVVAAGQARPAPLSLCGVEVLGAVELAPGPHMARPAALLVSPPALQPHFTLPINGDSSSCLEVPAAGANSTSGTDGGTGSSWQLQLDGSYPLLAVRVQAAAAPNASMAVSLLDAGGRVVAHRLLPVPPSGSAAPGGLPAVAASVIELPLGTHAAAVRVQGFTQLCEAQLLAASTQAATSYLLQPRPSGADGGGSGGGAMAWQVLLDGAAASGSPASGASALFDGSYHTCLTAPPAAVASSGRGPQAGSIVVVLDRTYKLHAVQLVAGGLWPDNVTIAAVPGSAVQGRFAATWAAAPVCQPAVALRPWQPVTAVCAGEPLLTDRLLVQVAGPAAGSAPDAGALTLCELGLQGLPVP